MIEHAEQDEALMDSIIVAILSSKPKLKSIPPESALVDDGVDRSQELSLTIKSDLVGKSIGIVCDYQVAVTLQRRVRDTVNDAAFTDYWKLIISTLQNPPAGLSIYSKLSHLTIDDIASGGEAAAEEADYSRTLTFQAFMSKR